MNECESMDVDVDVDEKPSFFIIWSIMGVGVALCLYTTDILDDFSLTTWITFLAYFMQVLPLFLCVCVCVWLELK